MRFACNSHSGGETTERDETMTVDLEPVARLCQENEERGDSLVMLLQEVQGHYGYLPQEVIREIGERLGVPLAHLYALATFYRSFSLSPRGKHEILVCTGTACHVRGAPGIIDHLSRRLGVAPGETTDDGLVTVISVNCLGACALGPVVVLDGTVHGNMTLEKVDSLLESIGAGAMQT